MGLRKFHVVTDVIHPKCENEFGGEIDRGAYCLWQGLISKIAYGSTDSDGSDH